MANLFIKTSALLICLSYVIDATHQPFALLFLSSKDPQSFIVTPPKPTLRHQTNQNAFIFNYSNLMNFITI